MMLDIAGRAAYAYTGGKAFDPGRPAIVFLHGAQHDHSVWGLQTRYFAHHGFSVLAPDLPGHGRSAGPALSTIGALADWVIALLDAAQADKAIVAGHSMGSLIALDTAARHPARALGLALISTAAPMTVSDALLDAAREHEPEAIGMVNEWSHSTLAAKPSAPAPGFWLRGVNQRLMERVSAQGEAQLFHTDFSACNAYAHALERAATVQCPVLVLSGKRDVMTPPRAGRPLVDTMKRANARVQAIEVDGGHALMAEQPDAVLDALFGFALECAKAR